MRHIDIVISVISVTIVTKIGPNIVTVCVSKRHNFGFLGPWVGAMSAHVFFMRSSFFLIGIISLIRGLKHNLRGF